MPVLKKLLSRFNREEKVVLEVLIEKIASLNWHDLDIKKLQGYHDVFRARKGKIRIIFYKHETKVSIINIDRRNDKTYRF
ncbi:MAG: hypothetical protein A3C70_01495 [Candidatus Zambryskibacteria bacterium RIFCSPHIGHO2_02_FULL_43_14]|uniref:Addiction module toxin RelE n=1 Tax=Candidatus Zambryskibacteria bacterium RIFCSPHIGHO2_02_FULL_43_14 TaxID=1802748 RepID=A0A1G2THU3_9BACT|nr:MAG: hypothetical protein A2829_03390 [Candidatus Zambryskibacteria bacterium RIFCSPHIGHO2_01_FULL_43_60]OHA96181.1 MAG: hypothetical protein A3C70_01495 [Candidatus Zambryskibacteria bacterium RIFCSPHIGHO2_02_FULL_43_14]OHB03832.1 MAG: hypothetical protein A3B03_03495 [Candidatus Zambryskibacteria bacterium RIFCSPLOWO2_01_FULL_42_41]